MKRLGSKLIKAIMPGLILSTFVAFAVTGQTLINLATQGRNIDFSKLPSTRPEQTGSSVPSTCVPGELFFDLAAQSGQNLYSCVAANTWSVVGANTGLRDPGSNGLVVRTGLNATSVIAAPSGAIVGTTDTQSLTNKTVDGVSPAIFGYLDVSSSIQNQLNSKQSTLSFTGPGGQAVSAAAPGVPGHCAQWTPAGDVGDAGAACGSGSGTVNNGASNTFAEYLASGTALSSDKLVPVGAVVGTTDTQTLTNKSIDASEIATGTLTASRFPAFSGDVSTTAGSTATTLSTVNLSPGSYGDSSHIAQLTVDAKGRVTQAASVAFNGVTNFNPDPSIANIAGQYSVSGLVNVLSYACGINIRDGNVHTVGNSPSGTCFNGITTLAGLAAVTINGQQPFAWINASSNNIFTSASDVYKLTNASVPSLDIAWLCIQSALINGTTYMPAGNYVVGSSLPLPLYIPITDVRTMLLGLTRPDIIRGDGEFLTNIVAGSDFGAGVPLLVCGDPAGNATNQLGRYVPGISCQGLAAQFSLWSNQTNTDFAIGASPVAMDGFAWGAQLKIDSVRSNGFYNDWTIVGDHTTFINATAQGGTRGFYWPAPNAIRTGDLTFVDLQALAVSQAGLVVSGSATITASFKGETYISAPYPILGESGGGCSDILYSTEFDRLMTEYSGNALIADDNGFSNGVYTDSNKCRGIHVTTIGNWLSNYVNSAFWGTNGRGRRASIDVGPIGAFVIEKLNPDGGSFSPTAAPSGPAPIATINATNFGDNGLGGTRISGHISTWLSQSGSLPLARCAGSTCYNPQLITIEQPGEFLGFLTGWTVSSGNYTTTNVGDVFEHAGYSYSPGGQGYDGAPANVLPAGIVMQSGITPSSGFVPLQTSGTARVNLGSSTWGWGIIQKASGIGAMLTVSAAGQSGTNGSFSWTATGGGCTTEPTGSFTVSGGAVTAATITTQGSGCTAAPAISTSSSAGLTGAQIVPVWPGALGEPTATLTGTALGMTHGGNSPGNGGNYAFVKLQGLQ